MLASGRNFSDSLVVDEVLRVGAVVDEVVVRFDRVVVVVDAVDSSPRAPHDATRSDSVAATTTARANLRDLP
ncbi:MAG: hypothetical protein ACKOYM_09455 [Actinomycetes bacterium]